jgi:hypothetical protein
MTKTEYWKVMAKNSLDDPFWGTSDRIQNERLAYDLYFEFLDRFKYLKMIHYISAEDVVIANYNMEGNEAN